MPDRNIDPGCLSCLGLKGTPRISPGPPIYIGEYWQVACYAEQEGFEHIHFHVVPRAADMPLELRGAGSFSLLGGSRSGAADPDEVRRFCELLQSSMSDASGTH